MAHGYRNYSPDHLYLLPQDPRDWLSEDCLAYQVRDIVGRFDLTLIHSAYSSDGRGAPAFDPQMMLSIMLYGQYKGISSCRGIKRLCSEDLGARYLTGGLVPDHRSISLFRIRHGAAIRDLFKQSVLLCRAAGMVTLKHTAIDGTKIPGAGSKESSITYAHIVAEEAHLTAEMEAMVQAALDLDLAEDQELGEDNDGFSLPDHLKTSQDRVAALRKAKEELEARARERELARQAEWDSTSPKDRPHRKKPDPDTAVPNAGDQYNFTDPESRMMKGRGGYLQGYNAQACADSDHQIIIGCGVTDEGTDHGQLVPMTEQAADNVGEIPEQTLLDAGYFAHKNIREAEARGHNLLVPPDNSWKRDLTTSAPLTEAEQEELSVKERMHHILTTEQGRADYALRMQTIEPVFGQIKGSPGNPRFSRFLRRGLDRADEDWCFVCMGHNLRKLIRYLAQKDEPQLQYENRTKDTRKAAQRLSKSLKFRNMVLQGV